ncbi:MAG TPA: GNAT family N-acetyltransferase [Symbiobacteriaceae bacterium]|nr:GNAT family N-acetyltransferase [Symbiobacteriaceae bacterium]
MTVTLRRIAEPADCDRLAELMSLLWPVTAHQVAERLCSFPPDAEKHYFLAVDEADYGAGMCFATHYPFEPKGLFWCRVVVDPRYRGQGVGAMLLSEVERVARAHGGLRLNADIREDDSASLAWCQRRGFAICRHAFESVLDLATYDEAPFLGALEQPGIRFFTLADQPGEQTLHKLYELVKVTSPDNPLFAVDQFPDYDQWVKLDMERADLAPDCVILAADGDRLVAMTSLSPTGEPETMTPDYTCVHPEYRGRGLALAVKVLGVRAARRHGAQYIRTNNDSTNAPMLAVNWKLGYKKLPGFFWITKALQ